MTIENGDTLDSHKNDYLSHSKLEVPKSFKYINISGANDPRSVEAIIRNKKQCRMLDLNIPTTNMLTRYKQILPSKCNTVKHTVQETTKSNTNQLLKRKTIRKDTLQYNLTQKKINIRKDTAQYDHIRRKTNDDSNLPILPLICKNTETCNALQNNRATQPNKKKIQHKDKVHNNIAVSENRPQHKFLINYTSKI